MRRSWRYSTDLAVGDVIAAELTDKQSVGLRVIGWKIPVFEVFPWNSGDLPQVADIEQATPLLLKADLPVWVGISNLRRADPDWSESGFERIGTLGVHNPEPLTGFLGFSAWHGSRERLLRLISEHEQA